MTSTTKDSTFGKLTPWRGNLWQRTRRLLIAVSVLVTIAALFYAEENWRGRRAWERCKRELEAKGAVLDWSAYIPLPVPDEKNIFKAPKMTEWFVRYQPYTPGTSPFLSVPGFLSSTTNFLLAQLSVVSNNDAQPSQHADIDLRFANQELDLSSAITNDPRIGNETILPSIKLEEVPITHAISNFARQAGIKCRMDPNIRRTATGAESTVSLDWTNVSARQALLALLGNYNLRLIPEATSGNSIIVEQPSGLILSASAEQALSRVMDAALQTVTNASVVVLQGAQGFSIAATPSRGLVPVQILVRTHDPISAHEIASFFSKLNGSASSKGINVRADASGPKSFRVYLTSGKVHSAGDYLAWSDQFKADFDSMRKAFQRPYARIEGDYSHPISMPTPNFVTFRVAAQILAQRAQCHLLLGDSAEALDELALVRETCRRLEAPPSGKPMTLVSAMINVAISQLYVSVVADGVRLRAWNESQLKNLQGQLASVKLAPSVIAALRQEPAAICQTIEASTPWELQKILSDRASGETGWLGKITAAGPRGWCYQNMQRIAAYSYDCLEGFDEARGLMFPEKIAASMDKVRHALGHRSAYNYIAAKTIPYLDRAWQTTARSQAFATEGQIVCALERYHNAHHEYPESLNALVPDFLEKTPHDLLGQEFRYRRTDSQFLLYSPGWDQVDGGGKSGRNPRGVFDPYSGDWVWFEQQ